MRLDILAVVVVVAAVVAVPTAALTTGEDDVSGAVVLSPADGPNGEYATVEGGELRVDFERLNDRAVTSAHRVVTVRSTADRPVRVWVETDVHAVTAYRGADPGAPLDRPNATRLAPNETLAVGFAVDTLGTVAESGNVTVGVEDARDGGGAGGRATPPRPGVDVHDLTAGVEVTFAGDVDPGGVTVTRLESLPADGPPGPPRAVIDPGSRLPGPHDDGIVVHGSRFVTRPGTTVELTGARSSVRTADGIARQVEPASIVSITPPRELRDRPATVRIRVARAAFAGSDAERARIGRHTSDGWQLLPTKVVDRTDDTVLLEARTFGFSVFSVFVDSQVTYEWTLPNGTTVDGHELRTAFDEPGRHDVTLAVTDALGRSDTTTRRVLANDRPTVSIERVENGSATGDEVTLRANVTDEVGNVTVRWTLPDGTVVAGSEVRGAFAAGETVRVRAVDEFGATGRAAMTVGPSSAGAGGGPFPAVGIVPFSPSAWFALGLAGLAVLLVAVVVRSGLVEQVLEADVSLLAAAGQLLPRRSPRITALGEPRWNPSRGCFEIDELRVEAAGGVLRTVEVRVVAGGRVLVSKTIEVGGRRTYRASPERIIAFDDGEFPPERTCGVEVRAVDEHENTGTGRRSASGLLGSPA